MKRTKTMAVLLTASMVLSHGPVMAAETGTEGWIEEQDGELEVFQSEPEPVFEAEQGSLPESAMEMQEVFQSEPAEEELFTSGEEGQEAADQSLTVSGGEENKDYQYDQENKVLKILKETSLTITGRTTECRIEVMENVKANLTIENLHMDIQEGNGIKLNPGANLNLTLEGNNQIYPGFSKAGICVPQGTALNILGEGALDVRGGRPGNVQGGAGIGANPKETLGTIQIQSGKITARSVNTGSAGIGAGGWAGPLDGSSITISGGEVKASASAGDEGSINAERIAITGGIVEVPDGNLNGEDVTKNNCLIAENNVVKPYGTFTLPMNYTIPEGSVLEVPEGAVFNTDKFTLVNEGEIINLGTIQGTIQNHGCIINYGTLPENVTGNIQEVESVEYVDENGEAQTKKALPFELSPDNELITGWYVVRKDMTINSRFQVKGEVNLILEDGASLTVDGGIGVTDRNTLKIYGQEQGTGKLVADAGKNNDAGIGGNDTRGQRKSGIVKVHGGTVEAYANGAGIGGASVSGLIREDAGENGTVTITGGTVTARSTGGAGIGGGVRSMGMQSNGGGGIVTITGGIVKASSSGAGSAIGAGGIRANAGTITINGDAIVYAESTSQDGLFAIGDKTNVSKGIIFETIKKENSPEPVQPTENKVYGNVTLKEDLKLPQGVELEVSEGGSLTISEGVIVTIPEGVTVTIPEDATITNQGTIEGNGTIWVDGELHGTQPETTLTVHKRSEATVIVTFEGDEVNDGDAPYGSTIHIKAAVNKKQTRSNAVSTENVVDFYLGDKENKNKLNKNSIPVEDSQATLNVELVGEKWKAAATPYSITAVFSGSEAYKRAEGTGNLTVNKSDLSNAIVTLENAENLIYTGEEHKPAVKSVVLREQRLNPGTDYEVTYKENTNAGTAAAIVTGKENYAGTVTKTFEIQKASLDKATLDVTPSEITYDGEAKTPKVTVSIGGKELSAETDYEVTYKDNTNAGTATAIVTGKGNCTGTVTKTFEIQPASLEKAILSVTPSEFTYDGTAKTPTVTVKFDEKDLVPDQDYTCKFSYQNSDEEVTDPVNAGTILVRIQGKGNYTGEKTETYQIKAKSLEGAEITLDETEFTYDGTEKTPKVTVKMGEEVLSAETDYEVTYRENTNAGTAAAIVTGKGNYAGTAEQTFTIAKASPILTIATDKQTYVYEEPIICKVSASAEVTDEELGTLSIWNGEKKLAEKASVGNKKDVEFAIDGSLDVGRQTLTVKFTGNTNIADVDSEEYHTDIQITPKPYEITLTGKATGYSEITLNKAKVTPEDAAVTYAVNTKNEIPQKGWQEGLVFSKLSSGTTYYFFAKAAAKGNYGEAISKGVAISTWSIPVTQPTPSPLPDNVPDGSVVENGNIITPEGTVIKPDGTIVLPDGTVIAPEDGKKPSIDKEGTVTTPNGTEIDKEGTITVPGKGTESKEDDVTITTGTDGKKPQLKPDTGIVTTPEGGSVIVPDGQGGKTELEVPEGSTVTPDGLVTFPDGTVINEKGEIHRPDESIWDLEGKVIRPGTPVLETVVVPGGNNKVKATLSKECAGAMGYDFVISKNLNCIVDKDYTQVSKNQLDTSGEFFYIQEGTYYIYCHAWTKNSAGKKVFGKWSGGQKVEVTAKTPAQPKIRKVSVSKNTVTVTYTKAAGAEGYDVILGKALKKVNGELRPVDYGKAVKKIKNKDTVTVTFKKVPKGTYYVGLHTYNRTSQDGKKVFSPWSKAQKIKVK